MTESITKRRSQPDLLNAASWGDAVRWSRSAEASDVAKSGFPIDTSGILEGVTYNSLIVEEDRRPIGTGKMEPLAKFATGSPRYLEPYAADDPPASGHRSSGAGRGQMTGAQAARDLKRRDRNTHPGGNPPGCVLIPETDQGRRTDALSVSSG